MDVSCCHFLKVTGNTRTSTSRIVTKGIYVVSPEVVWQVTFGTIPVRKNVVWIEPDWQIRHLAKSPLANTVIGKCDVWQECHLAKFTLAQFTLARVTLA